MKFTIPRNILAALAVTMAKNDVRYYLNGVLIEVHERELFAVSADGNRLSVYHATHEPVEEIGSIILAGDFVERLVKSKSRLNVNSRIKSAYKNMGNDMTIVTDGFDAVCKDRYVMGQLIDGLFPKWRKVLAHNTKVLAQDKHIDVQPRFVGDIAKQGNLIMKGTPPRLCACGWSETEIRSALVGFWREDFTSLVMGLCFERADTVSVPSWYKREAPQDSCATETA